MQSLRSWSDICGSLAVRSGECAGLAINRLPVRLPAAALSDNDPGQVVHMHVPLSPSSIIWYRSKGGDAVRLRR